VSEPTLEEVRAAKDAIVSALKDHRDFAGAGIGRGPDGHLVVQVNWRTEPAGIARPERVGNVAVTHQVVGSLKPFAE
jgi:hypothetical protein